MPMRNDVSLMESIRQSDFKKIEDTKTKNYLVVSQKTMKFILNDYKTNKKYHQLTIPIEDKDLRLQLKRWIKQEGYGILFKTSTNKGMSRNELSKFLIKYSNQFIGKSVSTTLLRKSYLTNKYLPMKEEMEKDSNILAHDVSTTGLNVYVKKTK